jgi:hypothetical protein
MGTAYNKAILAALVAGLGVLSTAFSDGELVTQEWIGALIAALVALGGVYQIPNKTPDPPPK